MTVSDLIKALADFSPSSEVRVRSIVKPRTPDRVTNIVGEDRREIHQGKIVFLELGDAFSEIFVEVLSSIVPSEDD